MTNLKGKLKNYFGNLSAVEGFVLVIIIFSGAGMVMLYSIPSSPSESCWVYSGAGEMYVNYCLAIPFFFGFSVVIYSIATLIRLSKWVYRLGRRRAVKMQ